MTKAAPEQSLDYIAGSQRADGSFAISSDNPGAPPASQTVQLLLHASLLDAIRSLDDPLARRIADRLAGYLLASLHTDGRLPFDQTDTSALFHTLAALYDYNRDWIGSDLVASLVQHLIDSEVEPGGPYRNALDSTTDAPDLATNISICRFIHHIGGPFPKLTTYIEQGLAINPHSRYYTALWPLQLQVEYFCTDPHQKPGYWYSMPALAAANALVRLAAASGTSTKAHRPATEPLQTEYNAVMSVAHQAIDGLDPTVSPLLKALLTRIVGADHQAEIGLLAIRFAPAVTGGISKNHLPKTALRTLGAANLYNWAAYTVYDDFLDDEGQPQLLSAANIALRKSISLFRQAVPGSEFEAIVAQTFDTIDAANAWEIANCRFSVRSGTIAIGVLPDYGNLGSLYQRSLSHSLPVLGALVGTGVAASSPGFSAIRTAFQEYLVIRQLSDDLHDWKDDLRAGHISYVVARILADAHVTPGSKRLAPLISRMERAFWQHTLPAVCAEIGKHARLGQQLLVQSNLVQSENIISLLIQGVEQTAAHTLSERYQAKLFLAAYRSPVAA